ncbi:hypothetical protein Dsin_021795 [Dipteronia sinensis]|uniref:Reverse transcriptase domain-containing protein n=1 Tax=Dipteronia sinensis TaxID=43782 RepID=A0AAE0A0T7_9ROSI|nr:hypothetical protein Dsin_021795 [Dipteronia sinensis]
MEVLSKILAKCIEDSPNIKFHWNCDMIMLSHLCFTDDLIMLCHGSLSSALVLQATLVLLVIRHLFFTSGVSSTISQQFINLFGYTEGKPLKERV